MVVTVVSIVVVLVTTSVVVLFKLELVMGHLNSIRRERSIRSFC